MDTTQEPKITLVELDNILAGELDQKWSALTDSMKQFVFEQVKGKSCRRSARERAQPRHWLSARLVGLPDAVARRLRRP